MSKVVLLYKGSKRRYKDSIEQSGKFIFETKDELNVYDLLKVDKKYYSVCMKNFERNVVGVDRISFNENPEWEFEDDIHCPYCGSVDDESYLKEEGENYCGRCGSDIYLEFSYYGDYMVTPIKPTNIILIK